MAWGDQAAVVVGLRRSRHGGLKQRTRRRLAAPALASANAAKSPLPLNHALTPDKAGGLIDAGNVHRVYVQAVGVLATFAYSFVVTFVLARIIDATLGLRVGEEDERMGLDLALHGETGYDM